MLTWDDEVITDLLSVVETAHYPQDRFVIHQMLRDGDAPSTHINHLGTWEDHFTRLKREGHERFEWYLALAQPLGDGLRTGNFKTSWAVAADFDDGLPTLCEPGEPLAPTAVIETSPGLDRFHVVWQFRAPVPADYMHRLAKVIAARLGGDMSFARVNQTVRLPGFVNQKRGLPARYRRDLSSPTQFDAEFLWKACDGDLYEAGVRMDSPQINHTQPGALKNQPDLVAKHARAAVDYLKGIGHAEEYSTWFAVLVNLVALGAEGHDIALDFSKSSRKFDAEAFEKKWAQLVRSNSGALSTLFAMAQRAGWKNPGWSESGSGETARTPSEREFGAMIARELAGTVAAVERDRGQRGPVVDFFEWNGGLYVPQKPREKRALVERAAVAVLERRRKNGDTAWSLLEKKLGNNRQLEEVCEHVAEALAPMCEPKLVSSYPYFPVANGVLNLLTRELVPPDYRPISRAATSVAFDPIAQADRFLVFLREVLEDDDEMVSFVLRALGSTLLGRPTEQVMYILLGPSGNGKSTLMEVLLAIFGPYGARLRTETLMQKSHVNDGASPALANIAGKRLVVVAEPNRNHKLDTSLVKQLTGEGAMYMRGLFSDGREVPIECCLFMTANFMPFAEAQDKGLWRRIRVLPFNRIFEPEQIDQNLKEVLLTEASGILNVLLRGLADYFAKGGLKPPAKVTHAVTSLRQEADAFEVFLQDRCVVDHMQKIELKQLWAEYQAWAKENSKFRPMTKGELAARLDNDSRFERKSRGNLPLFMGLTLATG